MKFNNFRILRKLESGEIIAEVEVQYREFIFFIKKKNIVVFSYGGRYWSSLKTGEVVGDDEIHNLYRAYQVIQKV